MISFAFDIDCPAPAAWGEALAATPEALIAETLSALAGELHECEGAYEIAFALYDDEAMRALNAQFRGVDKPTNVLSFPAPVEFARAGDAITALGDVALARETIMREAAEQKKAPAEHFRHLIAHGILHLFGYDHQNDAEAERMETVERRILARLGIADPYRSVPECEQHE